VNPGGALAPYEVVGRELFVANMWAALEVQSVLLTAERRMGKTSVLKKLQAEGRAGFRPMLRNLQDVRSPDAFVERVQEDVDREFPRLLTKPGLRERLGITRFGAGGVELEFDTASASPWQRRLRLTFAALEEIDDGTRVVFLWDELPHMLAAIEDEGMPEASRELLDILRATREQHACIRMVFSGSLGLHHVLKRVRPARSAWVPTHDMRSLDLPALERIDALALTGELLRNEGVPCTDAEAVAVEAVSQTDAVPFYIHHTVAGLIDWHRTGKLLTVAPADVHALIEDRLGDPQDPWQLMHYLQRVDPYYGEDATLVRTILDAIAIGPPPSDYGDLSNRVAAHMPPPGNDQLHELIELLAKDHYLATPALAFRLQLLRRAWRMRRRLA
jgi:hypothetical protein